MFCYWLYVIHKTPNEFVVKLIIVISLFTKCLIKKHYLAEPQAIKLTHTVKRIKLMSSFDTKQHCYLTCSHIDNTRQQLLNMLEGGKERGANNDHLLFSLKCVHTTSLQFTERTFGNIGQTVRFMVHYSLMGLRTCLNISSLYLLILLTLRIVPSRLRSTHYP